MSLGKPTTHCGEGRHALPASAAWFEQEMEAFAISFASVNGVDAPASSDVKDYESGTPVCSAKVTLGDAAFSLSADGGDASPLLAPRSVSIVSGRVWTH